MGTQPQPSSDITNFRCPPQPGRERPVLQKNVGQELSHLGWAWMHVSFMLWRQENELQQAKRSREQCRPWRAGTPALQTFRTPEDALKRRTVLGSPPYRHALFEHVRFARNRRQWAPKVQGQAMQGGHSFREENPLDTAEQFLDD